MKYKKAKKSLLFIAPDALKPGISRAFWLAKSLSQHYKVYYIQWNDSRNYLLNNSKLTKSVISKTFVILFTFFDSILPRTRIEKENKFGNGNLFFTYIPFMPKSFLRHIIGEKLSAKLTRLFNKISLLKFCKKKKFSAIFHGDGFLFSPILSSKVPSFYDIQDDFEETKVDPTFLQHEMHYFIKNQNSSRFGFAINKATVEHLKSFNNSSFIEVLPNGANFSLFNLKNIELAKKLKKELGLENKIVISFIGTATHFDEKFVQQLVNLAIKKDPELHFLFAGNLPLISGPNVTNLGFVSPEAIHLYYLLTDIGFLPKNHDDQHIANCHPLKVIQYSAAKKPVLTPLLSSFDREIHKNIFKLPYDIDLWLKTLLKLKKFTWPKNLSEVWEQYSWQKLGTRLFQKIEAEISKQKDLP